MLGITQETGLRPGPWIQTRWISVGRKTLVARRMELTGTRKDRKAVCQEDGVHLPGGYIDTRG